MLPASKANIPKKFSFSTVSAAMTSISSTFLPSIVTVRMPTLSPSRTKEVFFCGFIPVDDLRQSEIAELIREQFERS